MTLNEKFKSIDNKNSIFKNLITVKGVGKKTATIICKKLGILPSIKSNKFKTKQVYIISEWSKKTIEKKIKFGNQLKIEIKENVKNEIKIKTFKGYKFVKGLPIRGQRTKTNRKTARKLNKWFFI